MFVYGGIHLHYADRPKDDLKITINDLLIYENCADFFTTQVGIYLDNTTIPCQTLTITNVTTNESFSLSHIGKNQCKSDHRVFVIIVSVLGAVILIAVAIYLVVSIYQECTGNDDDDEDDD